jgi:uncharacterized protein (DUF2249 family)
MKTFSEMVEEREEYKRWDDLHKKLIDKDFFACSEDHEPKDLIAKLKTVYKGKHKADELAKVIKQACEERGKETGMDHFIARVAKKLGETPPSN